MHSYKAVNAVIPFAQRNSWSEPIRSALPQLLRLTALGCQLCTPLQNADVAALIQRFFLLDALFVKEPSEM